MFTIESLEFLQKELESVEKWEKDQKDLWFWEKLGRIPFKLLDKITPKFLQDKALQILDEIGSYVQTGGKYLVSEKSILKNLKKQESCRRNSLHQTSQTCRLAPWTRPLLILKAAVRKWPPYKEQQPVLAGCSH